MPSDAEYIADRRRLRRKLTFWRVAGFLAVVLAIVAVAWQRTGFDPAGPGRDQIARVSIGGVILNDRDFVEMLDEVAESGAVRGVVVSIDSPGGTTTGAEEIYAALRRLSEAKPTVAFVDSLAASGGYIAALGADRIVSRQTAIVGSIGVLMQAPNVSDLLDRIGVDVIEIKSSPLKAAPSPVNPPDPAAVAALQVVIDDTYAWFVDLVGERRPLTAAQLQAVIDGRVHNGRQALALGLVDALGTEADAIAWLEQERGVPTDLPVRDWEPERDRGPFDVFAAGATLAALAGWDGVATTLAALSGSARVLQLDGLLALWQPRLEN